MLTRSRTLVLLGFSLLALSIAPAQSKSGDSRVVLSFEDFTWPENWMTVNDGVMGGVSRGTFARGSDDTLLFTGELSLENNGGFSSIRSQKRDLKLAGYDGLSFRARGDGRTYMVNLRTGARRSGWTLNYRASFPTRKGEWTRVSLPFSGFRPTLFGRVLDGPELEIAAIRSVGFMIADKKAGPFRLEVGAISAWKKEAARKAAAEESSMSDARAPEGKGADEAPTIAELAQQAGRFSVLLKAAQAAGLAAPLASAKGAPLTVFAPTDEAFAKLPEGTLQALLRPENRGQLRAILELHLVEGRTSAGALIATGKAVTLGGPVRVGLEGGRLVLGEARVLDNDLQASNGIVHVIDRVLLPKRAPKPTLSRTPTEMMELAIERGAPLFNAGQPAACAAIYEVCVAGLLSLPKDALLPAARTALEAALLGIQDEEDPREQAWTLRRGIDAAYGAYAGQRRDT